MEATLLNSEQVFGKKALDCIKKYGTKTSATDLSVVLECMMSGGGVYASDGLSTGYSWLTSPGIGKNVESVCVQDIFGKENNSQIRLCGAGIRPALAPSETVALYPKIIRNVTFQNGETLKVAQYGSYPQTVVAEQTATELEQKWYNGLISPTQESYIFNSRDDDGKTSFKHHFVFEYGGEKYIRVRGSGRGGNSILSNGKCVEKGKPYWIKVEPIEWLMDEKTKWWVTRKMLVSGIEYCRGSEYDGDFENTYMYEFLNNYFVPDMQRHEKQARNVIQKNQASNVSQNQVNGQNNTANKQESQATKAVVQNQLNEQSHVMKPYRKRRGLEIETDRMSVKEQIQFYVEGRKTFMLHGPSGIGKTARVRAIDRTLTSVPLWNGILPEDVVGKVVYPTGEIVAANVADSQKSGGKWIAPSWYTEVCKKAKAEPNRMHVLFIDEVTNARETTQSLIFHLVLNRSITQSDGRLPDNVTIVLAGNSKSESGAAYNMPEPLFRRMAGHIYLKDDICEWLEWASEANYEHPDRLNVHAVVAGFVAAEGMSVFRTKYEEDEEERENVCEQYAIDPRGWEQVSDIVYQSKGRIRRELIENKLGPKLAKRFIEYAKRPLLTLEDVIERRYAKQDIPNRIDERIALVCGLRWAKEEDYERVKAFIRRELSREYMSLFERLWIEGNEERMMKFALENEEMMATGDKNKETIAISNEQDKVSEMITKMGASMYGKFQDRGIG